MTRPCDVLWWENMLRTHYAEDQPSVAFLQHCSVWCTVWEACVLDVASVALQVLDLAAAIFCFIFTSIIKVVYWVRQHRGFILLAVPRTIASFPSRLPAITLWLGLPDSWSFTSHGESNQCSSKGCKNEIQMEIIWYSGGKGHKKENLFKFAQLNFRSNFYSHYLCYLPW